MQAVEAVRRDRDQDQTLVNSRELVVIETATRRRRLHDNVGGQRESLEERQSGVAGQIERDAALVQIGREPAQTAVCIGHVAGEGRLTPRRIAPTRGFDLYDVRAEVTQDASAQRARTVSQVENA